MIRGAWVLVLVLLAGCVDKTPLGPCIGVGDDEKDPRLVYKLNGWNIGVAILFMELIIPPVIVLANETYCPVGLKPTAH